MYTPDKYGVCISANGHILTSVNIYISNFFERNMNDDDDAVKSESRVLIIIAAAVV